MTSAEEVKSRLDIIDLIQDYLPLKKRGASYLALCPFHQEKSPSFHVSRDRQFYKCFGCGEGGDIFDFVGKMEGLDFPETLRLLAEKAGVKIDYQSQVGGSGRGRILDLLDLSARFYHEVLLRSGAAEEAREYLKKRGLKSTTVDMFNLGFAPQSWDSLLKFLTSKKYTATEIFQSGLSIRRERESGYYDRFRGRIMFPIRDVHSHVIGFTARLLPSQESDPKAGGKYVNTPQTDFYNKSRVLFGLDMAKREIKNKDLVILVEGNMDVISCHEAGEKNVVASSGTAITEEQITLLRRFTDNIALSFDVDKAGELAAEKGIGLLLSSGMNVRVIQIPEGAGKDPDEVIRKNPELWKKTIFSTKPVMQYLFAAAEKKFGRAGGRERKDFANFLIPYIAKINDAIERDFSLLELAGVLGTSVEVLREQYLNKFSPRAREVKTDLKKPQSQPLSEAKSRFTTLSERLLSLLLFAPQNFQFVIDRITPMMLSDDYLRHLYEAIIVLYNSTGTLKYENLKQNVSVEQRNMLDALVMKGEIDFSTLTADELQKEMLGILRELRKCYLFEERRKLTGELASAERGGDQLAAKEIYLKIQELFQSGGEHL